VDVSRTTVLITGATDGVGKLMAKRAAVASARVLVHGRTVTTLRCAGRARVVKAGAISA
jgi:short-subunit dehydrogenase